MKKKNNKNFKLGFFDLIIIPILAFCFILGGMFYNKYEETKLFYNIEQTSVDYIIQTPSKEQIVEISSMSHIDKVTPYIYSSFDFQKGSKTTRANLFVVEDKKDINFTPFSKELLIEESKNDYANELSISRDFAATHSLRVGDKLTLNIYNQSIDFNVKSIYFEDKRSVGGMLLAVNAGKLNEAIQIQFGNDYKYSGAYIKSNNAIQTEKWLANYKPLGDLLSRDEFDSVELYQIYLDNRDKTDYTLTTFYKNRYLTEIHNRYDSAITEKKVMVAIIQIVSFLAIGILLSFNTFKYLSTEVAKDIRNGFSYSQEQKMFLRYFISIGLIILLFSILFMVINLFINNMALFSIFNLICLLCFLIPIGIVRLGQVLVLKKRFFTVNEKK